MCFLQKFEDTELDLKPLPGPKLVATPEGIPNELFGDVSMITEFLSCYKGLLLPDTQELIKTRELSYDLSDFLCCLQCLNILSSSEDFLTSLIEGKQSFELLGRLLSILLQTLLQDELAEVSTFQ